MSELVIRVPGEPFAAPRARSAPLMRDGKPVLDGRGRPILVVYDQKKAKSWKHNAQNHMIDQCQRADHMFALTGPVSISILAVFTCPKTDQRKREPRPRRWHTKRPDADNVTKAVKDAAKGVLWLDDCQVCKETCVKLIGAQGEAPFIEIRVRSLEGGDVLRYRSAEPAEADTERGSASISNPAPGADPVPGAMSQPPADQPVLFEEE